MASQLTFVGEDPLIQLTERWYWVSVKRFRIEGTASEEELLGDLVLLRELWGLFEVRGEEGRRRGDGKGLVALLGWVLRSIQTVRTTSLDREYEAVA